MEIIITTFKREDKIKCIEQIPWSLYKYVNVFTRMDRVDILKKHIPKGIKIIANPMDIDGIADIRQRCIEKVKRGKVWIIDDQVTFYHRKNFDFTKLYNLIDKRLDQYIQVGISPRQFNNSKTKAEEEIGRAYATYGLRTDLMQQLGIRFDGMYRLDKEVKFYEDFYLTLRMLTSGFKNLIINDYFFTYSHGIAGGNSTERTIKKHGHSAKALQKQFPGIVKLVTKQGWKTMEARIDVKIQWKKAYIKPVIIL